MELQPDGSALFAEAEEEIERLEALLVPSADADGGGERASADVAIGAAAAAAASATAQQKERTILRRAAGKARPHRCLLAGSELFHAAKDSP